MAEAAIREADKIGQKTLIEIDAVYANVTNPVLEKHKATLNKIQKLVENGKDSSARALMHSSGLLDELSEAIAAAGRGADELMRNQRKRILEVMADDDGY